MAFETARLKLSLAALKNNLAVVHQSAPNAEVVAMVKANAYGHGVIELVAQALTCGVNTFGVATVDEAVQLRKHFQDIRIILWGGAQTKALGDLVDYRITPVLHHHEVVAEWLKYFQSFSFHVEVNTGIGRSGLSADQVMDFAPLLRRAPGFEALTTHYFESEVDNQTIEGQRKKLEEVHEELGCDVGYYAANSGAILQGKVSPKETFVRPGILLYGYSLCPAFASKLIPVGSFQAKIIDLKTVAKGEGISYNHSFQATRETVVATLGAGYADGIPRVVANRARAQIGNVKVPMIGNICMDVCCLDVTDCTLETPLGTWVTLFGPEREAEHWARMCQTIVYENLCHLGPRVKRVWEEV